MFANPLFYYSCGHISETFALGHKLNAKQEKICPQCRLGAITTVGYDCDFCGASTQTTACGFQRSRRMFCARCRKEYNRWETMKRKAEQTHRTYPAFADYVRRQTLLAANTLPDPALEPPLSPQEIKDLAKYGKRVSPCAVCANITRDKNAEPCANCLKRLLLIQTPAKIHLDSLYL